MTDDDKAAAIAWYSVKSKAGPREQEMAAFALAIGDYALLGRVAKRVEVDLLCKQQEQDHAETS